MSPMKLVLILNADSIFMGKSVSCLVQLDENERAWCAVTGSQGANYDLNTWLTETYNTFQGCLVG